MLDYQGHSSKVRPLLNLDFRIRIGDSLIDRFEGVAFVESLPSGSFQAPLELIPRLTDEHEKIERWLAEYEHAAPARQREIRSLIQKARLRLLAAQVGPQRRSSHGSLASRAMRARRAAAEGGHVARARPPDAIDCRHAQRTHVASIAHPRTTRARMAPSDPRARPGTPAPAARPSDSGGAHPCRRASPAATSSAVGAARQAVPRPAAVPRYDGYSFWRRRSVTHRAVVLLVTCSLAALSAACGAEQAPPGAVHLLTADGPVDRVLIRYIERGLDRAEREGAAAVLVRVDTPGGELDAMRDVAGRIERARLPVVTYVAPPGARAASAGTFIVMAGHVAAMAPGTTIGAATPITVTGDDVPGALGAKVRNDTAAFARSVAELRGRNATWAEQAVREAVSASAAEAAALGVVDLVAEDIPALLAAVEGRTAGLGAGAQRTITVQGAPLVRTDLNAYERVLRVLGDPLVVTLLLLLGIALVTIELHAPGLFVPGALGALVLLVALVGVGTLLPEQAAVALLVLGGVLGVLELFLPGGVLGTIAALAILLGLATFLAQGSTEPDLRFALTVAAIVLTTLALLVGGAMALLARRYIAPTERTGGARL